MYASLLCVTSEKLRANSHYCFDLHFSALLKHRSMYGHTENNFHCNAAQSWSVGCCKIK